MFRIIIPLQTAQGFKQTFQTVSIRCVETNRMWFMRIAALLIAVTAFAQQPRLPLPDVATFSIVAYDPAAGEWGVTVASRYFSVGSVVPWAEAGVGAIATQANVNVGYGPRGLELLRQGLNAKRVLERLQSEDKFDGKDGRQIAIIDAAGGIAAYTGPAANTWAGDKQGKTWSAQGNILVGPQVVEAMGKAFEAASGDLAEKLYAALRADDTAGGDSRGKQSASMLVVRKGGGRNTNNDRPIYLNVDDSPAPLERNYCAWLFEHEPVDPLSGTARSRRSMLRPQSGGSPTGGSDGEVPDGRRAIAHDSRPVQLFRGRQGRGDYGIEACRGSWDSQFPRHVREVSAEPPRVSAAILEDADFMRRLFQ